MRVIATPNLDTGSIIISGSEIPQTLATIYRYNDDGSVTILRGAQNIPITNGVLYAEDSEAAFDVPLRYVILFNIGDRVVQRNLITNPSLELNTTGWAAGPFRTASRVTYADPDPAYAGTNALMLTERVGQSGDSTTVPYEAPLANVIAPFTASTTSKKYEFSFRTRLSNNSTSFYTDSPIVVGTQNVSWDTAENMYTSWSHPYSENLSWAAMETAYIAITEVISNIYVDPMGSDWTYDNGTWNGESRVFTLPPEAADLRALNYVINPTLGASAAGYTSSATNGSAAPALALVSLDGETALRATIFDTAINPTVSFTASGLTVGTEYQARIDARLPAGQVITVSALNYTVSSAGTPGDGSTDWVTESVIFTAAATTETINVRFNSVPGAVYLDHAQVSLPEVDYFDGSSPDSLDYFHNWSGAANASASVRTNFGTFYAPSAGPLAEFEATWTLATLDGVPLEVVAGFIDVDGNELVTPIRTTITGTIIFTSVIVQAHTITSSGSGTNRPTQAVLFGDALFGDGNFGGVSAGFGEEGWGTAPYGGSSVGGFGIGVGELMDDDDAPLPMQISRPMGLPAFGVGAGTASASGITLPLVNTTEWEEGWRPYVRVASPGAQITYEARNRTFTQPVYNPYTLGVRARVLLPSGVVLMTSDLLTFATVTVWNEARWEFTMPAIITGTYKFEIVPEQVFASANTSWQIDAAMLEPNPPRQAGRLTYLDGSIPVPTYEIPGWVTEEDLGDFDVATDDALIRWVGAAHASASEFLGPSQVTLTIETLLPQPDPSDVDVPECEPINLSDPTVPELGAWFTLQAITGLDYAARSASYTVINRRAPIIISQTRATPAGSMVLLLQTLNERQALLDLVASGRVLLLRNPNPLYPEDHWYLSIGSVSEERIAPNHQLPFRKFTLEFQVVDRPGGLIAVSKPPSWADVVAAYEAWGPSLNPNSVLANVPTWTELIRRTPKVSTPFGLRGTPTRGALGTYFANRGEV